MPIGLYYRIRSQATGERLSRRNEGLVIGVGRRLCSLLFWLPFLRRDLSVDRAASDEGRMRRRGRLLLFLALGLTRADRAEAHAQDNRPNVLLLLTDDQGHGDLGFHGKADAEAPGDLPREPSR
jgi:hypothetical protein